MLTVKEKKEKARKEKKIALKENARKKDNARCKKNYQILKKDHPDILQMRLRKQTIKCLEDTDYGEKCAQQTRTCQNKSRTTSKKCAEDAGNRFKPLSPDRVALVKSSYIAWKGSHSTMRGFYKEFHQENHALLKGYDGQRLQKFADHRCQFWLPVLEQLDNAEGETSETILESGMIENQVMPAMPPLHCAV